MVWGIGFVRDVIFPEVPKRSVHQEMKTKYMSVSQDE